MSQTYATSDLIQELVAARKARGLSQRELGEKVGWPQSHVSTIEKGKTDLRLSGLIELARALDLEVALVPKKSVPAVESVVRQSLPPEGDKTAQALEVINKASSALQTDWAKYFAKAYSASDAVRGLSEAIDSRRATEALRSFNDTLNRVQVFRFDNEHFKALQEATKPVEQLKKLLEQTDYTAALRQLTSSTEQLKRLRNELAHPEVASLPKPAYRLDEDDDA